MATISFVGDILAAKASAAGRLLGAGASDPPPYPLRELTGVEAAAVLPLATPSQDGLVTAEQAFAIGPNTGLAFTADETAANTMNSLPLHGQRRRWQGTSAARHTVPNGLTVGTEYVIVSDASIATAQLTVNRASADGNVRRTNLPGARLIRRSGRCRIHIEDGNPRITGDLDPVTMDVQGGGASFLLERGLLQAVSSGVLQSWGDKYGNIDFNVVVGSPSVGDFGEMSIAQALDVDAYLFASAPTFAGVDCLVGLCIKVDAIVQTCRVLDLGNFGAGRGFRITYSPTLFQFEPSTNASIITTPSFSSAIGRYVSMGAAVHRAGGGAGYVYAFCDEGYKNREQEQLATGATFVVDWTGGTVTAQIGPTLSASQSITAQYAAATCRDNVSFANANDARDQAAAMLHEMREYAL